MDDRFRRLEREAAAGSPVALKALAMGEIRRGNPAAARALMHPLVKQDADARAVFLTTLPIDAHAFCVHCGVAQPLGETGYPLTPKGNESRRRRLCETCTERQGGTFAYANVARRAGVRTPHNAYVLKERYCGRCGASLARGHRCESNLPAWVTGAGNEGPVTDHWSLGRGERDDKRFDMGGARLFE